MTAANRVDLAPVLAWLDANIQAPAPATPTVDAKPNRDNTALKLADQGCFWVGVQRKQMSYGAIAMGQMYVQYMVPAEKRYPYPVIMVHGFEDPHIPWADARITRDKGWAPKNGCKATSTPDLEGIHTTIPILKTIFDTPAFIEGKVDTTFIERELMPAKA